LFINHNWYCWFLWCQIEILVVIWFLYRKKNLVEGHGLLQL
jgi:membrane protein insertase Oxa1/YidC/SpoIIIJ